MPSFFSSSFDAVTVTTATNAAPADNDEAPAKNGSEKEAVDKTVGATGSLTSGERRR